MGNSEFSSIKCLLNSIKLTDITVKSKKINAFTILYHLNNYAFISFANVQEDNLQDCIFLFNGGRKFSCTSKFYYKTSEFFLRFCALNNDF